MPSYSKSAFSTPFGRNVFLRSTQDIKTVTHQVAAATVPARTIDGNTGQKVLQPGTVLAKILTGPYAGMVGPFQTAGTDEVQTITEATNVTAGTFTITILGATTAAIQHDATAATVQAAIRAAVAALTGTDDATLVNKAIADGLTVAGGPVTTTPFTITYNGELGANVAELTVDATSLTGTVTVATSTAGVAGATDGRGDTANIVGINNTFLPSQLMDRDVEVAVIYEAAVVQAQCIILNAAGVETALDNTTAAAMVAQKSLDIKFF